MADYPLISCKRASPPRVRSPRRWLALGFAVAMVGSVLVLTQLGAVNSIFSTALAFLLTAAVICAVRHDLIGAAIISAVVTAAILVGVKAVGSLIATQFLARYWLLLGTRWDVLFLGRVVVAAVL